MHDVAVALDVELLRHAHGAGLRNAADVVSAQVKQHHVLGHLFLVGPQLGLEREVLVVIEPARRVPAIGCVETLPSSTITSSSGDVPTIW